MCAPFAPQIPSSHTVVPPSALLSPTARRQPIISAMDSSSKHSADTPSEDTGIVLGISKDTSTITLQEVDIETVDPNVSARQGKPKAFWLIFFALSISVFIVVLEGSSMGNVLPTIAGDLDIAQFTWIGTTYQLASTALLPLSGGLAQIFGRRPVMLVALILFATGGAVSGSSNGEAMLFTGRTLQGLGAGGVLTLTSIVLSDILPLQERGVYNGLLGIVWSGASGVGPIIGGTFAQSGHWRWLFYVTIPISGLAATLVLIFVKLPKPDGDLRSKLRRIDWIGNAIVMSSSTAVVIAMTWGGVEYAWISAPVLVPLVLGMVGLGCFLLYEGLCAKNPLIPLSVIQNRTSISGYLQTAILSVILTGFACKNSSPITSGFELLGAALTLAPMSLVSGAVVAKTGRYRPPLWAGWVLVVLGQALLMLLRADSARVIAIVFSVIIGTGTGFVYSTTYFPVLAPLSIASGAPAMALYVFLRTFGQVWGVAIGGSVLQNQLMQRLPSAFYAHSSHGTALAYATIPVIPYLAEPLRTQVRTSFADSLAALWRVQLVIAVVGLVVSFFMRGLPLHTETDREWDTSGVKRNE
ncbi:uncharacterized protein FIBRA_04732 [Fibroporia radiculosa]|uniref:Major facilitator superfamily (MFS) profile domain-containing protein n=1 Tax=Fibroporia radiculosa TaxID=599839 RepID=J4H344_9APHY|nr:uncharacterized protein FIBRA_04732 [Fibroporia radiculosa]CCM02629.1 predicted protein [Fibroporia radiculosa]